MPTSDALQFSPDILSRLGEELIPHVDQGIIELVRNSYDADATECLVELIKAGKPGGTLRITDNGVGMTISGIRSGWLVLGRSPKTPRSPTTKLGRLMVGDKGLGRLAALRLGSRAMLTTRPEDEKGAEYRVVLDWSRFDGAATVESVPVNIERTTTTKRPGTVIEVSGLRAAIARKSVQRLARSLVLLADPFGGSTGFQPRLRAPEYDDLARRVGRSYFPDAVYRLCAKAHGDGSAEAIVYSAAASPEFTAGPDDLRPPYNTAAATFELWVFILDKLTFSTRTATIGEVRKWLGQVGGVHLYHRGLRVSPYGDAGHDWLEMNLRRSQSPELRPSTNTSIGKVVVPDPDGLLLEKTDRAGFVETNAFVELRRFAVDALEWMARERIRQREQRRQTERGAAPKELSRARAAVKKAIGELPTRERGSIRSAVSTLEEATEREVKVLREDVHLYRTLATVGTASAVFAHESEQPVSHIDRAAKELERCATGEPSLFEREQVGKFAQLIRRSCQRLSSFAGLPLSLLKRDKRVQGEVDVHGVIMDLLSLFRPFLEDSRMRVTDDLVDDVAPAIAGTVSALESVLANLLMNAAYALRFAKPRRPDGQIVVQTGVSGGKLVLRVMDNGPGVIGIRLSDIWLPGYTTKTRGTGLGLTIVRDIVADLGGTVNAISPGELGGAEFVIALPMRGATR